MPSGSKSYNQFLADLAASQKFLTGDWYCIPAEGKIYNRFHAEVKGCTFPDGYRVIGTKWYGEDVNVMHHRALWIGAHGGVIPDPGLQIDHINGVKADNRIENLRLVTPKENCNNPVTIIHQCGEHNHNSKISDAQRSEIRARYERSRNLPKGDPDRVTTRSLAFDYGLTHQQISVIIRNIREANE